MWARNVTATVLPSLLRIRSFSRSTLFDRIPDFPEPVLVSCGSSITEGLESTCEQLEIRRSAPLQRRFREHCHVQFNFALLYSGFRINAGRALSGV